MNGNGKKCGLRSETPFAPAPLPVPETPPGKMESWGKRPLRGRDVFYQARLAHPDPDVAERAARAGTPARFSRRFTGGPVTALRHLAGV